jgi:hypothetical protein
LPLDLGVDEHVVREGAATSFFGSSGGAAGG